AEQVSQIDDDALEKSTWDMDVDDTVDVLPAKNQEIRIDNCPEDAKGSFSLTIDGKNKQCTKESNSIIFDASKLTLGQHKYDLNFLGDDKYAPATKSGILNVSEIIFIAPESFRCSGSFGDPYDDLFESNVKYLNSKVGTLKVYTNDKLKLDIDLLNHPIKKTYDEENYFYYHIYPDASNQFYTLYFRTYAVVQKTDLRVEYRDNDTNFVKSKIIDTTYRLSCPSAVNCGEDLSIDAPNDIIASKLSFEINGTKYKIYNTSYYDDGISAKVNSYYASIKSLPCGNYAAKLSYSGDKKYPALTKDVKLSIIPSGSKKIFVGEDLYLDYENGDPIGTQDNLPLFYDDEEFNFEEYFKDGNNFTKFGLEIDGKIYDVYPVMIHDVGASERFIRYVALTKELPCGNYLAKLNFNNEDYKIYNLSVIPYDLDIGEDWTYGDFIRFMYSNNLTGYIKIEVNSKEVYNKNVNENSVSWSEYAKVSDIDISKYLDWGSNEVSFEYYGGNYPDFTEKVNLTYTYTFYLENMTFYYGSYYSEDGWRSNHYYLWNIPEELFNDKLSVKIDGVKYSIDYTNQEVDISQLDVGYHTVAVSYKGDDKFYPLTEKAYINVTYPKISIPKTVTNGNNEIVIVVPGKSGTFKITAKTIRSTPKSNQNTYEFFAKLVNGQAKVSLAQLSGGKYVIDVEGRIDGKYYDSIEEITVKNTKLAAKDTSVYYKSGNGFKVKVTTAAGKVIKNKYVKFYINGKYVKNVKTTKNGYATLKITKAP
uniref:hypothetical protein n=1 Tax=Methanobrevibacter sp. TaxID=66852 RepID=UPI003866B304